jgi:hypothetical protein
MIPVWTRAWHTLGLLTLFFQPFLNCLNASSKLSRSFVLDILILQTWLEQVFIPDAGCVRQTHMWFSSPRAWVCDRMGLYGSRSFLLGRLAAAECVCLQRQERHVMPQGS